MGAIMCRVVTCTPPWQLDGTCTTTEATDQGTLDHDRPCLHQPVGALDSISLALGNVRVVGWAADPDTPEQSIDVHVYLDAGFVTAAVANTSRPDVASAFPGFGPAHGFDVTIPVAGGSNVCVYAINRGLPAANPLLGCRPVLAFGNFESARPRLGGIGVSGWAIDAATSESTRVQVYVDGASAGTFAADGDRPDVAAAYRDYGAAHGFVVDLPMAVGPHQVCINALDRSDARRQANIGCRAVVVGGNPFGNFETVHPRPSGVQLQGWAIDPDTNQPVDIHVYVDQQFAGAFTANVDRPDVGAAFPDYGSAHGFLADVSLGPGSHNVCVYAINRGSGASNPVLGCRAVSSLPFGNFDSVEALPSGFRLQGWSIDPDTADPVNVHVYIDGAFGGVFTANADRPDVGAAYPQYGPAHGFSIDVAGAPGTHQLCVYAIDRPGPGVNPAVGCRSATR